MYNLLISLAAGGVTFAVAALAGAPWWLSLLISLPVLLLVFYLLARYVMKQVEAIVQAASKDLQGQRVDKAIHELKRAFRLSRWQFYIAGQINAQIGSIYYMKRDFASAFPYLEKAFFKNWVAMGMLAISYMKRNKNDLMRQTFEKAVQATPKESLLWNLFAYCLAEIGDQEKAKEVLERGLKKLPGDEPLQGNLALLREGKKMKMRSFGDLWFQFHLESVGAIQKHQMAAMGGMRRKVVRR